MKLIHCADIHLGSKMDSRLTSERAEERRRELRATFSSMVGYAADNGVSVIILAGDVFDCDRPLKKDKEFFYSVVKNNPQIDFLYLRGNHDKLQSYTESLENLKTFSDEWTEYRYGRICVSGAELTKENNSLLYSSLKLDDRNVNIVVMHGLAGSADGKDEINLKKLRDRGIDYLALGHLHSFSSGKLDGRGVYAYSGCLEGRGFDEAGEKGFILLDVSVSVRAEFIPFSRRTVRIAEFDVSAAEDDYEVYAAVKRGLKFDKRDIVRVVLRGEIGFDNLNLDRETEKRLESEGYYYLEVKDETVHRLDLSAYEKDISLKGEFVRTVLGSSDISPADKREIISLGLKALEGGEIEI